MPSCRATDDDWGPVASSWWGPFFMLYRGMSNRLKGLIGLKPRDYPVGKGRPPRGLKGKAVKSISERNPAMVKAARAHFPKGKMFENGEPLAAGFEGAYSAEDLDVRRSQKCYQEMMELCEIAETRLRLNKLRKPRSGGSSQ